MAKGKGGNKRQMRPSWFQKQMERAGGRSDWLNRKPPLDIQKEAMNIVRDIARGNIAQKDYEYLFNSKILENVRLALFAEFSRLQTIDSCMSIVMQMPNGKTILRQNYLVDDRNFQIAFNETRNRLNAIYASLQTIDSFINFIRYPGVKPQESYDNVYMTANMQLSKFKYDL